MRDVKETHRRRDALYTGAETRWSLCCRIAHLEADMLKLREENQSIGLAAYELGRKSMAAENVKLRELCRRFSEYVSHDRCEGCVVKRRCNDGEINECWQMGEIRKLARELGIEAEDD